MLRQIPLSGPVASQVAGLFSSRKCMYLRGAVSEYTARYLKLNYHPLINIMNKSTSIFTICLYVLFLGLAGCAKDSGNGPDEDLNDEQLETQILGKWEISNFPTALFPDAGLRPQAGISKNMLLAGRAAIVAEVGGIGATTAFIEFLPDDTYLVQDAAGNA